MASQENESRIVAGMDPENWGFATDVQVHVVEPEEFTQRHIDVVALGGTVLLGGNHTRVEDRPVRLYDVSPREPEDWSKIVAQHNKALGYGPDSEGYIDPRSIRAPKGPLPREEAEQTVQRQLDIRGKLEVYEASSKLQRATQFAKWVLRKESNYVPSCERPSAWDVPEVLLFRGRDNTIGEIVVNSEAEAAVAASSNAR